MSTRITDLPQAEVLNGSEIMPLVQNGVTKKATLDFINLASPAALILQQTQQVYQDTLSAYNQTVQVQVDVDGSLVEFEAIYLGPHAVAPTTDNEGNPLRVGALYWSSAVSAMFAWSGSEWVAFSSAVDSVNGQIGTVIITRGDLGAAASGANADITSLSALAGDLFLIKGAYFDTAENGPADEGELRWNASAGALFQGVDNVGNSVALNQTVLTRVKNPSGVTIGKGRVVRRSGFEVSTGAVEVLVPTSSEGYLSSSIAGVLLDDVAAGGYGFAVRFGTVRNFDTTGAAQGETWAAGDTLYLSPTTPGGLTKVVPLAPNNRISLASVSYANASGTLFVNLFGGQKLDNDERVNLSSLTDGDVLQYEEDDGVFVNRSFAAAGIEPLGTAASAIVAHVAEIDPHPQYVDESKISDAIAAHVALPDPHTQYTTAAEAAAAAPVQSVAGKTGAVSLASSDVGLGNVTNNAQLKIASNLSDLNNVAAARSNLGLGAAATAGLIDALNSTSTTDALTAAQGKVLQDSKLANYTITITAVGKTLANRERCSVTAATQTITLPAAPEIGWEVSIMVGNFTDTVVDGNSRNIMGLPEDLTIDKANVTVTLLFVGSGQGWRII